MSTLLFPVHTYPANDRSLLEWSFAQKESNHRGWERKATEFADRHADWFIEKGRNVAVVWRRDQLINRQMTGAKSRMFYLCRRIRSCNCHVAIHRGSTPPCTSRPPAKSS